MYLFLCLFALSSFALAGLRSQKKLLLSIDAKYGKEQWLKFEMLTVWKCDLGNREKQPKVQEIKWRNPLYNQIMKHVFIYFIPCFLTVVYMQEKTENWVCSKVMMTCQAFIWQEILEFYMNNTKIIQCCLFGCIACGKVWVASTFNELGVKREDWKHTTLCHCLRVFHFCNLISDH